MHDSSSGSQFQPAPFIEAPLSSETHNVDELQLSVRALLTHLEETSSYAGSIAESTAARMPYGQDLSGRLAEYDVEQSPTAETPPAPPSRDEAMRLAAKPAPAEIFFAPKQIDERSFATNSLGKVMRWLARNKVTGMVGKNMARPRFA